MAFRLIFTSSPSSLTGSRTGFCTVARSAEMSEKLALFVEKCGAYEHEKMQGKPIFSHRRIWLGDKAYHILSRAVDSGADYTNRSNYIADHLILTEEETALVPSPAQAILEFGGWLDSYGAPPRFLGNVEIKKSAQKFAPPASLWKEIFADEGKAALLLSDNVELCAKNSDGEKLLKLFAQAAALCSPETKAWDYTFTTALCRGENPQDFSWKTYISASGEEHPASINLISKTAPAAPQNAVADFARTAKISNRDRLNLKVQRPSEFKPKIKIARDEPEKSREIPAEFKRNILIIAAAAIVVAAACLVFAAMPKSGGDDFDEEPVYQNNPQPPRAQAAQKQTAQAQTAQANPAKTTYSKVRADIKDLIKEAQWQKALDMWDDSGLQDVNPKARAEILNDMGRRFDNMLVEAQGLIESGDAKNAAAILEKAKPALEIDDFPHKSNRENMMKGLNSKIKRL